MVKEKLIKVKPYTLPVQAIFVRGKSWRIDPNTFYTYNVMYEYWYDGVKFYIGSISKDYPESIVEANTFARACTYENKRSAEKIIEDFKSSLDKSGKTIHEVLYNYMSKNLDLIETCLINLLII